ncbi:MAG: YIP1 family protein [Sulfitobacter sp.]
MQAALGPLIALSIRDPRTAARNVLDLTLGRDALWTGLALVAIVNTFLVLGVLQISPSPMPLPSYFDNPLVLYVLITGLTVVYVHAMYWAGLTIGGKGELRDVLALVVWFQVLRAAAQVALIVLSFAVPGLGALASLVVAVWGIWIFMNFIATALNLASPWHAIAVLLVAFVGLVLGLGVLMALIGGLAQGVAG